MSSPATRLARAGARGEPTPADVLAGRAGVRMRPLRPARALLGALLMVTAVVATLAIYSRLGDRTSVLALNRTVLAGEQITAADLRVVGVSSDDTIAWVTADERATVVGQHARYRLAAGALLVRDAVQARPLVTPGTVLVGIAVPATQVPVGLREQSAIVVVVVPPNNSAVPAQLVPATVVAVPPRLVELAGGGSASATVTLSIEIAPADLVVVAGATNLALALIDPLADVDAVFGRSAELPPAAVGTGAAALGDTEADVAVVRPDDSSERAG